MTTAAQRLAALSGLPTGTAAQHLLAVQPGGVTVFGARAVVQVETAEYRVLRKAQRSAAPAPAPVSPTRPVSRAPARADTLTRPASAVTFSAPDAIWVVVTTRSLTVSPTPVPTVHVRRQKTIQ